MPPWATILYLMSAIGFVRGIKLLTSVATARQGNRVAGAAMAIALLTTVVNLRALGMQYVIPGVVAGTAVGAVSARRVAMTAMPQMVALFNGMGAGAAALVGVGEFRGLTSGGASLGAANSIPILLSCLIGGISFSGSLVAFAKLQELMTGKPVVWPMRHLTNAGVVLGLGGVGTAVVVRGGGDILLAAFLGGALLLGVVTVLPVGGADMPVVISVLNSFTGTAAAVTGFVLGNDVLIVSGALVGASGSILTVIMSRAMNRSLSNVLFGAFGSSAQDGASPDGAAVHPVRRTTAEDVALLLTYARQVIFVPGYGLAVARAQHEVKDLAGLLEKRGVRVLYAIHPVAGRMPGHMNVLLAEADVPYSQLLEMELVNPEFARTDVAVVIGANDVVNPGARHDRSSPIYGMPILDVDQAQAVVVLKRSMSPGFAGVDNELFYQPNTLMLFGDARDSLQQILAEVKLQVAA